MRSRINSALSLSLAFGVASLVAVSSRPAAAAPPPPIVITGSVEANYTLNTNQPESGVNNLYAYNTMDGQFALNLADVRISRAATPDSRVGFFVRTIGGAAGMANFSTNGPSILEAYGTMLVPIGKRDIKIDAGQFVTHVGYETIELGSNNFFSRSYIFNIPEPVFHAGVRASIPLSSALTAGIYLYNRYSGTYDVGNRDIAPGFSLAYNPNPKCSVILNGLTSRELILEEGGGDNDYKQQSILNLIASDQFSKSFKGVVEGVYRFGDYTHFATVDNGEDGTTTVRQKKSYGAYGVAVYGIYSMANSDTIGLRAETFSVDKPDTFLLSYPNSNSKPNIGSVTLSYEPAHLMKNFPNLRTIIEYREDFAGKDFFEDKKGSLNKKTQGTITIGQSYSF